MYLLILLSIYLLTFNIYNFKYYIEYYFLVNYIPCIKSAKIFAVNK